MSDEIYTKFQQYIPCIIIVILIHMHYVYHTKLFVEAYSKYTYVHIYDILQNNVSFLVHALEHCSTLQLLTVNLLTIVLYIHLTHGSLYISDIECIHNDVTFVMQ